MAYKCLMIIMLGTITLGLTLGCEDSAENAARKQVNQSIEQVSQLIQQGQSPSGGMSTDQESFNNALTDWDQMAGDIAPNDTTALKASADQITALSLELLKQEGVMAAQSAASTQQIQQILNQASAAARQSGSRGTQAGPDLLLAATHLTSARNKFNQLTYQAAQIHNNQAVISDLLASLFKEQKYSAALANSRPNDRINLLKERLKNPNTGLEQELEKTEAAVNQLLADRTVLQKQYQTARDAAVVLQRQYNDLLIQADNAAGAERFKLQQQAYNLQIGYEQDGTKITGSIELEALAQRRENQLTALESKLQYQLLWQGKLREDIRSINDTLDQLQSVAHSQSITNDYDKSVERTQNLIELISHHLNELQTAEEHYAALRQEAADAFESARNTYDSVSMSLTGASGDYVRGLKLIVTKELAQLWSNDASHNQLGQTILVTAVKVPEINSLAVQLQQACESAWIRATAKAQEFQAEVDAAAAAEPAGGYPEEQPAAGGYPETTSGYPTGGYPAQATQQAPPVTTPPPTVGEPNAPGGDRGGRGDRSGRSDRGGRGRGGRGNQVSEPNRIR